MTLLTNGALYNSAIQMNASSNSLPAAAAQSPMNPAAPAQPEPAPEPKPEAGGNGEMFPEEG